MARSTLRRYELLARLLLSAAGGILVLTIAAALLLGATESSLPGIDELQRQSRGPLALLILAGGTTGAGLLAGLGAVISLLVEVLAERQGDGGSEDP